MLIIFIFEIVITSIAKKWEYFHTFFFYLDIIATISLLLDVCWLNVWFFGENNSDDAASIGKATRSSKVASKAGRIVRIVRLVRLIKLYK